MKKVTIPATIGMSRPDYYTECEYNISISEADFKLFSKATCWDDLPKEVYWRIEKKLRKEMIADLYNCGCIEDDEDPEDYYDYEFFFPKAEEEDEDEE